MTAGRKVFLAVASLGVVVAGFMLVRAAGSDSLYYLYPHEALERRADFVDGRTFQLAGTVVAGSLIEGDGRLNFVVTDDIADIPVLLTAPTPPLFDEGVEILIEGSFNGDRFESDNQPVIRHSAEYSAPEEGNAPAAGES